MQKVHKMQKIHKNVENIKNDAFFKDIQVSPVVYKIINEKNDKLMDDFYKWFEYFFDESENDKQPNTQQHYETNNIDTDNQRNKNNECNNTFYEYIPIGEKRKNITNDYKKK